MKSSLKLFIVFLAFAWLTASSEAKEWRGIVPLHSTRADVERLFGPKIVRCSSRSCLYDLGEETVFVLYADEPTCKRDDATTSWKVPRDTVIEIGVHFKEERKLADLGLDLSKFEKSEDKELRGLAYYTNREEGVVIEVSVDLVRGITYHQAARDNHLLCPKVADPIKPQLMS